MKKTQTMKRILLSIGADPKKLENFGKKYVIKIKNKQKKNNGK